ncbi:hypothetical protein [Bacillus massiliigorillae]|uniref:hypothetical protein n=1 Tax=Bacillus massiliigorillae TaxID=1243664 RepID=UPI0003A8FE4E|nr:hypothetical protein [Bacillus massiliigorillae]
MKKYFISIITVVLALIFIFYKSQTELNNNEILAEATNGIRLYHPSKNLIQNIKSEYDKNSKILIKVKLNDNYDNLDLNSQFAVLEYINRQLRYLLLIKNKNPEISEPIYNSQLQINGQTHSNVYLLNNNKLGKESILNSRSTFLKNNKRIFSTDLNQSMTILQKVNLNIDQKNKDIIEYTNYFYNSLTHYGRYYDPVTDHKIILNVISNKFLISNDEIAKIYLKYYFQFNPADFNVIHQNVLSTYIM